MNPTDDFEVIYEKNKTWGDYLVCNHCKKRVERGVASVTSHWMNCLERKEGLIVLQNATIVNKR
jgi:hypothetical protein